MVPVIHDSRGRTVTFEKVIDLVEGVGLRDQFALGIISELIAKRSSLSRHADLAKEAYQLADAMIKARGEK